MSTRQHSDSLPLSTDEDLDSVLDIIGDARHVMIGEASHGTSEFYSWRARLSQRLISEKGFSFVGVEGDWPDLYDLNRYVKGYAGESAVAVVAGFDRWPTWMWANWETVAFAEWLHGHNLDRPEGGKVGIYGLDVYSLWDSMERIIDFLRERDPDAVDDALAAWRCFEPYGQEGQAYGWTALSLIPEGCVAEAVDLLGAITRRLPAYQGEWEERLNLEQNAWVVLNAEQYYRTMVQGGAASWNVRDRHMMATLERLVAYHGPQAKSITWAHNTHVGDARATDMASAGMVNIGQLARERFGGAHARLVGFATHHGTVVAAGGWGEERRILRVPPALPDSWEGVLAGEDRVVDLTTWREGERASEVRGHRAIGVVYHPEREHLGNFVPTRLADRYDALLFLEETRALHPVHTAPADLREPPETYPFGV